MSFMDELRSKASQPGAAASSGSGTSSVVLSCLPANLEQLKAMPEAGLTDPAQVAALTVAALCVYPISAQDCIDMLNFLKGPAPLSNYEKQFLKDRFMDKDYVPRSYFKGAVPENDYEPSVPYTVIVEENPHSRDQIGEGYLTLHLRSGGADSPRQVKLRSKPSTGQWFLWEQFLLPDIRKPVSSDPWA